MSRSSVCRRSRSDVVTCRGGIFAMVATMCSMSRVRTVALEVTLVVLVRRRTQAAEVARGEGRFQDVRRVERAAVCGARPDHGVDLVDEEDGTWARHERRDDGLQTRLELAAELRAREQGAHVERVDLDVAQRGRDAVFLHAERESLDDGRLPD